MQQSCIKKMGTLADRERWSWMMCGVYSQKSCSKLNKIIFNFLMHCCAILNKFHSSLFRNKVFLVGERVWSLYSHLLTYSGYFGFLITSSWSIAVVVSGRSHLRRVGCTGCHRRQISHFHLRAWLCHQWSLDVITASKYLVLHGCWSHSRHQT